MDRYKWNMDCTFSLEMQYYPDEIIFAIIIKDSKISQQYGKLYNSGIQFRLEKKSGV